MNRRQRAQAKAVEQERRIDAALNTLALTLAAAFAVTLLIAAF